MVIDEKIEIGFKCYITANYITGMPADIAIEYTEHSSDHWHSDTETCIYIDKKKAIEIISFLQKHFGV